MNDLPLFWIATIIPLVVSGLLLIPVLSITFSSGRIREFYSDSQASAPERLEILIVRKWPREPTACVRVTLIEVIECYGISLGNRFYTLLTALFIAAMSISGYASNKDGFELGVEFLSFTWGAIAGCLLVLIYLINIKRKINHGVCGIATVTGVTSRQEIPDQSAPLYRYLHFIYLEADVRGRKFSTSYCMSSNKKPNASVGQHFAVLAHPTTNVVHYFITHPTAVNCTLKARVDTEPVDEQDQLTP